MAETFISRFRVRSYELDSLGHANHAVYLKHLAVRDQVLKGLEEISDQLSAEKIALYPADLLSFDLELAMFRQGKRSENFLPMLVHLAGGLSLDFSGLDQFILFEDVLSLEKQIDQDKLKKEAERLRKSLAHERLTFEELLRNEKISAARLEYYPESRKYLGILKMRDRLDFHRFFDQAETAIGLVKKKLIRSQEQGSLDARWERFSLAKKIMLFELVIKLMTFSDSFSDTHKDTNTVMLSIFVAGPTGSSIISNPDASIAMDGRAREWRRLQWFPDDPDDVSINREQDWSRLSMAHDPDMLYLLYETHSNLKLDASYNLFLDTDANTETGYRGDGGVFPIGADYLLQGAELWSYVGNPQDPGGWHWISVGTVDEFYVKGKIGVLAVG